MISQATLRIMACLRDTLKRLRHPLPRNSDWKRAWSAWSTAGDRRMRRGRRSSSTCRAISRTCAAPSQRRPIASPRNA